MAHSTLTSPAPTGRSRRTLAIAGISGISIVLAVVAAAIAIILVDVSGGVRTVGPL